MAQYSHRQTCTVKFPQLRQACGAKGRNTRSRQQINRIPDAMLSELAIRHRQNRHCRTSSQAADYSGRVTMDFNRDANPVTSFAVVQVADSAWRNPDGFRPAIGFNQWIECVLRGWKNFPKPTDCTDKTDDQAHQTDDKTGNDAGRQQGDSKSGNDRVGSWNW